jgi:hypothetical protein
VRGFGVRLKSFWLEAIKADCPPYGDLDQGSVPVLELLLSLVRRKKTTVTDVAQIGLDQLELPSALNWLNDAPLFIDERNLARFYDAVVRPPYKESGPRTIKISEARKKEVEAKLSAKGKIGLPDWVAAFFSAGVEASAEARGTLGNNSAEDVTVTFAPIDTPQRQLVQLAAFYLINQPERLLAGSTADVLRWQEVGVHKGIPRALAFVDLPAQTRMIPMAAEFTNGKVVTFFDKLTAKSGEKPPAFKSEEKQAYWAWFLKHFDEKQSTEVIEGGASESGGRIQWIDFRVPLNNLVDSAHLHLEPAGNYYTGALAYRLVRRTHGHGLRIVGTLMDGPDFNVLAVYEK